MDEPFILPVAYNGNTLELESRLVIQGYMHKFFIMIDGNEYLFELDDNREYRAIQHIQNNKKEVDYSLLQAVIEKLLELHQP